MTEADKKILGIISIMSPAIKNYSAALVGNPQFVKDFVEYAVSNKEHAWRAAWIIHHYSQKFARELDQYSQILIDSLANITVHGHIREILKTIYNLKLTETQTSEIFDICFNILQNNKLQSSVRGTSFLFLMRVANEYPELRGEIEVVFDNVKDFVSPGIRRGMEMRLKNKILTK